MNESVGECVGQFRTAITDAGLTPPEVIEPDGKLHRFGSNGERADDAGWYVLFDGRIPAGAFGDWRTGVDQKWHAHTGRCLSADEKAAHRTHMDAIRRERDVEEAKLQAQARKRAAEIWEDARSAPDDHVYLRNKGIRAHGVRVHRGRLVIPLHDGSGLCSLQFILADGEKRFLFGGRVNGCYFLIGEPGTMLHITEGYATAASVHEATGSGAAVAFNAGNLLPVALALQAGCPGVRLIICADDDARTPGNPGLTKAREAAAAVGGFLAVPDFGADRPDNATDFNDLHRHVGADAVRACIERAWVVQPTSLPAKRDAIPANSANPQPGRGIASANPAATPSLTAVDDADWDALTPLPLPTPVMFYGDLGQLAYQAASGTEVNPVAAMAAAMSYMSAAVGRNTYIAVGDSGHHIRLFTLHVGRSGRGGKNMAVDLLRRIDRVMREDPKTKDLVPQIHTGGLSSREGLALLIHDGYREGRQDIPPIIDKRLFNLETEFVNVLQQAKREGNTLSPALRDAWDGGDIKPATKNCRVWASHPHIAMHGCITPGELRAKLATNELTNGFANRHLIIWAERTGIIAIPSRTPEEVIKEFATKLGEIIQYGLAGYPGDEKPQRLLLSSGAADLYASCYQEYAKPHPAGDLITGLLERRSPMLLRIAGLFAITDRTHEISKAHIAAAAAWMDYYAQSVVMIFGPNVDLEGEARRNRYAEKLYSWLAEQIDWQSRKTISRGCFSGHLLKPDLDAALERLVLEGRIERREVQGEGPTPRTDYRANPAAVQHRVAQGSQERSQTENQTGLEGSQGSQSSPPQREQVRL